jgi:hypothetical protein
MNQKPLPQTFIEVFLFFSQRLISILPYHDIAVLTGNIKRVSFKMRVDGESREL